MVLKKVAHNIFDVFVGIGWDNWRRVHLEKSNHGDIIVSPTDKGSVTLTAPQLTSIAAKFNHRKGAAK